MNQNETCLVQKSSEEFHCNICYYSSSRKGQYLRHLLTNKHKMKQNEINVTNLSPKVANSFQCTCGMCFKSRTTLWRHKKKCNNENKLLEEEQTNTCQKNTPELVMELIKNNNELQQIILKQHNILNNLSNSLNNNNAQTCI